CSATSVAPLPLHDALPIWPPFSSGASPDSRYTCGEPGTRSVDTVALLFRRFVSDVVAAVVTRVAVPAPTAFKLTERSTKPPSPRSEEHTSELQSRENLVCR